MRCKWENDRGSLTSPGWDWWIIHENIGKTTSTPLRRIVIVFVRRNPSWWLLFASRVLLPNLIWIKDANKCDFHSAVAVVILIMSLCSRLAMSNEYEADQEPSIAFISGRDFLFLFLWHLAIIPRISKSTLSLSLPFDQTLPSLVDYFFPSVFFDVFWCSNGRCRAVVICILIERTKTTTTNRWKKLVYIHVLLHC